MQWETQRLMVHTEPPLASLTVSYLKRLQKEVIQPDERQCILQNKSRHHQGLSSRRGTVTASLQLKSRHHSDNTQRFGKWSIHWNVHTVHFQASRDHSPPPEIREQRPSRSRLLWSGRWHPWCLYKSEREVHIRRGWERKHSNKILKMIFYYNFFYHQPPSPNTVKTPLRWDKHSL